VGGWGVCGNITLDEAKAVLDRLPKNTDPGIDGPTYEFYTVFWPQMGPSMVAAFNFNLETEQLSDRQRLGVIDVLVKGVGGPGFSQPATGPSPC
jgi:hypothetical protein